MLRERVFRYCIFQEKWEEFESLKRGDLFQHSSILILDNTLSVLATVTKNKENTFLEWKMK